MAGNGGLVPIHAETSIRHDEDAWWITTPARAGSYAATHPIEQKGSEAGASVGVSVTIDVEGLAGGKRRSPLVTDPTRPHNQNFLQTNCARQLPPTGND